MQKIIRSFIITGTFFLLSFEPLTAVTYYSRQNGAFTDNNTWSTVSHAGPAAGSAPCSCSPCSISGNNTMEIDHAVSINCDMNFSGNPDIIIRAGGSLTVTGNASVTGAVVFVVQSGATVSISGNLNVSGGGGYITIDGTINIGGSVAINGSYPICGTGTLTYGTGLTGGGNICGTVTVLPVTWLYMEANDWGEAIEVRWATAAEINNDYFTVERAADGIHFESLSVLSGAGNSTTIHEYSYRDEAPPAGICYYRIRQTDYNGMYDYSATIAVYRNHAGAFITIVPTLVTNNQVKITFSGLENTRARIILFDADGTLLESRLAEIETDVHLFYYHFNSSLPQNIYFISIIAGDFIHTEKIIITAQSAFIRD